VKTRKPIAILAATAVAGLGLTALATPASANTTVTISGSGSNITVSPSSITGTSVTLVLADDVTTLVVSQSLSDADGVCTDSRDDPPGLCKVGAGTEGDTATFDIAPGANGSSVSLLDGTFTEVATFTVTYPNSSATGSSATGSTPAPVIQQFEKPATGSCDEAEPEGLDWGGAASGGWGESWAQWANEGQGGPVCTRTLEYNNSTATWQVQ